MPQRWDFCEVFKNKIHTCEIRKKPGCQTTFYEYRNRGYDRLHAGTRMLQKRLARRDLLVIYNLHVVLLLVNVMFPSELCQ